jgi:hypothetical protein
LGRAVDPLSGARCGVWAGRVTQQVGGGSFRFSLPSDLFLYTCLIYICYICRRVRRCGFALWLTSDLSAACRLRHSPPEASPPEATTFWPMNVVGRRAALHLYSAGGVTTRHQAATFWPGDRRRRSGPMMRCYGADVLRFWSRRRRLAQTATFAPGEGRTAPETSLSAWAITSPAP